MNDLDYSILILNYNGEDLISPCLEAAVAQMEKCSLRGEILVIDNHSQDKSREILSSYTKIRTLFLEKNTIMDGYNQGARIARGKILILLNNDERIEDNFIQNLISPFEKDENLFLSVPKTINTDNDNYQAGYFHLESKKGHYWLKEIEKSKIPETICEMNCGCLGAYRKDIFLKFNGFHPLFFPFYWEDIDLSVRAKNRGYKILYIPTAITRHINKATINRFDPLYVRYINRRNKLILFWLNCKLQEFIPHLFLYPLFALNWFWQKKDSDYLKIMGFGLFHCLSLWIHRIRRNRD